LARRKTPRKKKSRRKPRSRNLFGISALKVFVGFAVLILLVAAAGVLTHRLMLRREPTSAVPDTAARPAPDKAPLYEIFPQEESEPAPLTPPPSAIPPPGALPKVAIIIDDLGYDRRMARKFLQLDTDFTFSILPHTPHTRSIARDAAQKGREVMLHLPMEPMEYPRVDPGPGALLQAMSPDELIAQLRENLSAVPGIRGVDNHMGSRLTTAPDRMNQIFSILKQQNLYFVDSRSTAQTRGRSAAKLLQVPFAERDVFIDHRQEPEFIRSQLRKLVQLAKKNGQAVGILHPSRTTYEVLQGALPELQREVRLVPASQIVHPIG